MKDSMNTRILKSSLIALMLLLAVHLSAAAATKETVQPDILLIMPDQWRGDALSILKCPPCGGQPIDATN